MKLKKFWVANFVILIFFVILISNVLCLENANRYNIIALRECKASMTGENNSPTSTESSNTKISSEQQAIIDVANAFYYRGRSLQYDDCSMTNNGILNKKRRSRYTHYPEEATTQDIQYTVCAEFVCNVYYEAFSDKNQKPYELVSGNGNVVWYTSEMIKLADPSSSYYNHNIAVDYIEGEYSEINSNKEEYKKRIKKELEIGDIIVYRYSTSGHALLYLGDDTIINASSKSNRLVGGSYSYIEKQDVIDEKGSVGYVSLENDVLNYTDKYSKYIFDKNVLSLAVLRPLNEIGKNQNGNSNFSINEKTLNRMKHNKLVRSKTASIEKYDSVNLSDEITYTITLENKSETEDYINILVTDKVPENTKFVNMSEGGNNENGNLSWNVDVPKNGKKEISYTVKVKDDKSILGKSIVNDQTIVDGVSLNVIKIMVNNKLSTLRQKEISNISSQRGEYYKTTEDLINEVYPKFEFTSASELLKTFFTSGLSTTTGKGYGHEKAKKGETEIFTLNFQSISGKNKIFANMFVEGLFGGVYTIIEGDTSDSPIYYDGRNTTYTSKTFSIGDVLILYDDDYETDSYVAGEKNMYLYIDDNTFATVENEKLRIIGDEEGKRLIDSLIGQNCFIVLRPSYSDSSNENELSKDTILIPGKTGDDIEGNIDDTVAKDIIPNAGKGGYIILIMSTIFIIYVGNTYIMIKKNNDI